MALKVCKNFEGNRPLDGANEFFWLCNPVVFYISTQYAYHLIDLLMMSNFGPLHIALNQIVYELFTNMSKPTFAN